MLLIFGLSGPVGGRREVSAGVSLSSIEACMATLRDARNMVHTFVVHVVNVL